MPGLRPIDRPILVRAKDRRSSPGSSWLHFGKMLSATAGLLGFWALVAEAIVAAARWLAS
jgi:hypothetical protein